MRFMLLTVLLLSLTSCDQKGRILEQDVQNLLRSYAAAKEQRVRAENEETNAINSLHSDRLKLSEEQAKIDFRKFAERGDAGSREQLIAARERLEDPAIDRTSEQRVQRLRDQISLQEQSLPAIKDNARIARQNWNDIRVKLERAQSQLKAHQQAKAG